MSVKQFKGQASQDSNNIANVSRTKYSDELNCFQAANGSNSLLNENQYRNQFQQSMQFER